MRARLLAIAALVAVVLLSPIGDVEACGPDFEGDIFVRINRPDDLASFAKGDLGILQSGYDSNEYAVAYRYLNGGKLSDAERNVYAPPPSPPQPEVNYSKLSSDQITAAQEAEKQGQENAQPFSKWLKARAKYIADGTSGEQKPAFPTSYDGTLSLDEGYLNCPDAAFQNATLTLTKRADAWGRQSPSLIDWIHAQDAVFANCASKIAVIPRAAASDSPALLKADRAYQTASATFYAKQFDEAARQFAAIAADSSSPWSAWGAYLAARATVRKAFAMGKATDPYSGDVATYDQDTMMRAQHMLESLLKQPDPKPSRTILQDELNFIRIRTEPTERVAEICAALTGPGPDPRFHQDLADLSWAMTKNVKLDDTPPLLEWIQAWRSIESSADDFAKWQQRRELPWLLVAMVKAGASDPFAAQLIDAAAKIPAGSTAYDTLFFHRVRLLIALKRTDEARTLLDAALPSLPRQKPSSKLNALLAERMAVARNFTEFLTYAPRPAVSTGSQGSWDLHGQCNVRAHAENREADCPEVDLPQFDDAVSVLNQQTPISLLIEATGSPSLPANLRQNIAIAAWTRTVLLQDAASAAKLAPSLPKAVRDIAGSSVGFPADLVILRNPGIRPYLELGVSRVASFSYFDELRNNWWCKPWGDPQNYEEAKNPKPLPIPPFLNSDALVRAASEYRRLQQFPDSAIVVGQRVLDYAKDHPDDPLVPEALALSVRAGHYACQSYNNTGDPGKSEYTPISKQAFELLHRRYPKSSWALKTRYYY